MQLSKWSYYSDFYVYPAVVTLLIAANLRHYSWRGGSEWLLACFLGLALWSLLEYFIHRVGLHWMPVFSPMHAMHHGAPLAYIATPSWISVTVWSLVLLLPVWWIGGFNIAGGLTVGVMIGYWWYGIVHHVIHHHAHRRSPYFDELRMHHMRHHHSPRKGNFGVTSPLWDRLFGTVISNRKSLVAP